MIEFFEKLEAIIYCTIEEIFLTFMGHSKETSKWKFQLSKLRLCGFFDGVRVYDFE